MSTATTNFALVKPELTDAADITAMNGNWDTIDTQLKSISDASKTAGNITSGTIPITRGGTGASTAAQALTNLGITATATELNYVDGVTSNVQTQLNGKQPTISGAATTVVSSNLTTNRAVISNGSGKLAVSAVTSTELSRLSGVTSGIQNQLNSKVDNTGDTMTGMLSFNNLDAYHAIHKYRTIENVTYGVNLGCGILGGQGIASVEVRKGNATDDPLIGRLEISLRGVSFVDANGKRTYLHSTGLANASVE